MPPRPKCAPGPRAAGVWGCSANTMAPKTGADHVSRTPDQGRAGATHTGRAGADVGWWQSAAARRAGRYGLGLLAHANVPGMQETCAAACREHGHEPGPTLLPPRATPAVCFVADDLDAAWNEIGPYLLHDARAYAEWNPGNETSAGLTYVNTVDELRPSSHSQDLQCRRGYCARPQRRHVELASPRRRNATRSRVALSEASGKRRPAAGDPDAGRGHAPMSRSGRAERHR